MSQEITGNPDTFPSTVTTPANGDPVDGPGQAAMAQDLADQTAWLKARDDYAAYTCASDGTLTLQFAEGEFTLRESSTAVEVPENGQYEVSFLGTISTASTNDPELITVLLQRGTTGTGYSTIRNGFVTRFSDDPNDLVACAIGVVSNVTSSVAQYFKPGSNMGGQFTIRRVG